MYLKTLLQVIHDNRWFYWPYFILFIFGIVIQFNFTQIDITLAVNSIHNPFLDFAFRYITDLGDGIFASAVVLLIFIFLRKEGWRALLTWGAPSLFTQLMKHKFYANHFRPSILMKDFVQLHYVDGIYINELNSFPSGHSTTAFAIFCYLSLINSNKKRGILFLLVAALTGISRIYLLQHFFEDVLAGSFIGVSFATIIFSLFDYRKRMNTNKV